MCLSPSPGAPDAHRTPETVHPPAARGLAHFPASFNQFTRARTDSPPHKVAGKGACPPPRAHWTLVGIRRPCSGQRRGDWEILPSGWTSSAECGVIRLPAESWGILPVALHLAPVGRGLAVEGPAVLGRSLALPAFLGGRGVGAWGLFLAAGGDHSAEAAEAVGHAEQTHDPHDCEVSPDNGPARASVDDGLRKSHEAG